MAWAPLVAVLSSCVVVFLHSSGPSGTEAGRGSAAGHPFTHGSCRGMERYDRSRVGPIK